MNSPRDPFPLPEDLRVFLTVMRKQGFAAAAEELGVSPAYVSKRIQILEATLKNPPVAPHHTACRTDRGW